MSAEPAEPAGSADKPRANAAEDSATAAAILALVQQRGALSSACPSEVARKLSPTDWRERMPQVRQVARQLAQQGLIHITQGGTAVSPFGPFRGPIRLKALLKP